MSFADLESRVNAACMRLLFNAEATPLVGGAPFSVIFDAAFVSPLDPLASVAPAARVLDSDLAASDIAQGAVVSIRDVDYEVRELEPDGVGMTVLRLRRLEGC
jgi:hypothetical protein